MSGDKPDDGSVNQGIQVSGGNVNADVLAVGTGALASKTVHLAPDNRAVVEQAIEELRAAIAARVPNPAQAAVIERDVERLRAETSAQAVDAPAVESTLQSLSDKLEMAGVVLRGASDLVEPIKRIGAAIGVGLAMLL